MEGELFNVIKKPEENAPVAAPQFTKQFPDISFVPELKKEGGVALPSGMPEKCAIVGVVFGSIALLSWVVMLLGVLASIVGIVFSVLGLKSSYPKCARIGLGLSIVGLVASAWYLFAAYSGSVNYNYFTSEFWEAASGAEKGAR